MRKGEKLIVSLMIVSVVIMVIVKVSVSKNDEGVDPGIPFYSTANAELTDKAAKLLHRHNCQECHSLWATRDLTVAVPAPALDGQGTFRSREWLFGYFSAENPQSILPTRLKLQYRHPSYADLPLEDRNVLADYMFSLKVEDWYRDETYSRRIEKLTGQKPKDIK